MQQPVDYSQLGPIAAYILLGLFMLKTVWGLVSPLINKKLGLNGHKHDPSAAAAGIPADVDMRLMATQVAELCKSTNSITAALLVMGQQINDMHNWHSVADEDGVKVWYVRRSFYDAIERHNDELKTLTDILTELVRESKVQGHEHRAIRQELKDIAKAIPGQ